jgi:hypothetical protein
MMNKGETSQMAIERLTAENAKLRDDVLTLNQEIDRLRDYPEDVRLLKLQVEEYRKALAEIAAIPPTGDGALMRAQNIADEAVGLKPNHEHQWDKNLLLGPGSYCRICNAVWLPTEKRKDVKVCYKCGRQEATKYFAVCPSCYKDPLDG